MDVFIFKAGLLKSIGTLVGLFFMIALSPNTLACPMELPMITITVKGSALTAELATTPAARGCGLSQRDKLSQNHGMLFVFPDQRPRNFWMKDTSIPLSIAFLDDSGSIFSIQDMVPMQTATQYPSLQPAKYALEVNQGWFSRHGIEVGDAVKINLPLVLDVR